jgi:hypothetical protein
LRVCLCSSPPRCLYSCPPRCLYSCPPRCLYSCPPRCLYSSPPRCLYSSPPRCLPKLLPVPVLYSGNSPGPIQWEHFWSQTATRGGPLWMRPCCPAPPDPGVSDAQGQISGAAYAALPTLRPCCPAPPDPGATRRDRSAALPMLRCLYCCPAALRRLLLPAALPVLLPCCPAPPDPGASDAQGQISGAAYAAPPIQLPCCPAPPTAARCAAYTIALLPCAAYYCPRSCLYYCPVARDRSGRGADCTIALLPGTDQAAALTVLVPCCPGQIRPRRCLYCCPVARDRSGRCAACTVALLPGTDQAAALPPLALKSHSMVRQCGLANG